MTEIWKPIPNFENYEINEMGQVERTFKNGSVRFLTNYVNKASGYMITSLTKHGKTHHPTIHRLLATCFIPNPENKPQVDHINRNRQNNRLENLRWATVQENNANKMHDRSPSIYRCVENVCKFRGIKICFYKLSKLFS